MKSEEFATALVVRRVLLVCCLLWSAVANSSFFILHSSFFTLHSSLAQGLHRYTTGFNVTYTPAHSSLPTPHSSLHSPLSSNFADSIDIEFDDGRILLPVEIDGRKYRFLFDTGCTQGVLFTGSPVPFIREVGNVISFDINNQPDTVRVVQLPEFRLGHLSIDGYLCTVVKGGAIHRGYDGIVGFDLINKGLACKIDVEHKRLILTDRKKHFAQEQGYEVKYKLQAFVPYVWVSPFMRHMDRALFDTGYRQLYTMNVESFRKHVYKSKQVAAQVEGRAVGRRTIGANSVEQADTVFFLALDRLKWDDFAFRDYHTVTQAGTSHIGTELLTYGNLIINPFKKRMMFQPTATKNDELTIGNEQAQFSVIPVGGRPVVGLVREESEAYRNGLRHADTIIRIDQRNIPDVTAMQQFPFVKGRTYIFTVRRADGSVHDVKIKK